MKGRKTSSKVISFILSLIMVVTMVPISTAAAPADSGAAGSSETVTGYLQGETTYTLDSDGVDSGATYLILDRKNGSSANALRNGGSNHNQSVSIESNWDSSSASVSENAEQCEWLFTQIDGGEWNVTNGESYLRLNWDDFDKNEFIGTDPSGLRINRTDDGEYQIYKILSFIKDFHYYLRHSDNNGWSGDRSADTVYLYKKSSNPGEEVAFSITPGSASLTAGDTLALEPSVLVSEAPAENYTIEWSSDNSDIVSVDEDGNVKAVTDGTAYITAILTSANGTAMQENLQITIPVTVSSRTVADWTLTGNTTKYTKKNVEPDFSSIVLNVNYDDGTSADITTENGLEITGYDISDPGTYVADISYLGKDYGTVRVVVEGDPYEGLNPADKPYPEYPDDGAVRIDKTATVNSETFGKNGVGQVELDVAGISVKNAVDVVLVVDVSNSMGWSLENSDGADDAEKLPTWDRENQRMQETKLKNAMDAAGSFADILLGDNDENENDNTLTFVTFAGYDEQRNTNSKGDKDTYIDSVRTIFTGETNAQNAKNAFNGTTIEGENNDGTVTYNLTFTGTDGRMIESGTNRGNTNYDYGFYEAEQAVESLQGSYEDYAKTGRETYVVFMTDGAPSHYNRTAAQGDGNRDIFPDSYKNTYPKAEYTTKDAWEEYLLNHDNQYANSLYNAVGGNFYAIGFDLANGGFSNFSWSDDPGVLEQVISGMVTGAEIPVMSTADSQELTDFYESLATQIRYAGTNARVTDTIHSDYTLQMSTTSGTGEVTGIVDPAPSIDVMAYDLYTKADGDDKAGSRIPGSEDELEKVTFNQDGTEAYSTLKGEDNNIMDIADDGTVTINAEYFTYTKTPDGIERFVWNIGNITDQEVALIYDVYLKGTMEGTREDGVYDTNESAYLEYVDIDGDYARDDFPVPALGWGGATTSFEYYLVNNLGQPVNHTGDVIPWQNRIIIAGPETVSLNLNAEQTIDAQTVYAADHLPPGYFLYDPNASYTVQTSSGAATPGITLSEPSPAAGENNQNGNAQTTLIIGYEKPNYIWSRVAFGVRYDLTPQKVEKPLNKDQIVIDYGKAIEVDVLANDLTGDNKTISDDFSAKLTGLVAFNADTDTSQIMNTPGRTEFSTENGTYKVTQDGTIEFRLNDFLSEVDKVFAVVQLTEKANKDNTYYLYQELDVIPATSVYYETDFADGVFEYTETEKSVWQTEGSVNVDEYQNDGTVGQNSPYGYDDSYIDDSALSNGSSEFVDAVDDGVYTSFTFTGTGFDLISRTGTDAGMIRAQIYRGSNTEGEAYKTATVANVGASELYQIPVLSCEGLEYGTYTVKIQVYAEYTNDKFPALNRGGEFYFDAIRIYDPINVDETGLRGDQEIAQNAYLADHEAYVQQLEVRNAIISAAQFDSTDPDIGGEGVVYIDASQGQPTTENPLAAVVDYEEAGPNNEVYLRNDSDASIGFILYTNQIPESIQIGAKSALGGGVMLDTMIINPEEDTTAYLSAEFSQATAQNYAEFTDEDGSTVTDLTPYFVRAADGRYYTYVIIGGYGEDDEQILSITDVKATFVSPSEMSFGYSKALVERISSRLQSGAEENPEVPAGSKIISADFTTDTVNYLKKAELQVVTSADVEQVVVLDESGNDKKPTQNYEVNEDGSKIWSLKFKTGKPGVHTFSVYGIDGDGNPTEAVTVSIEATRK